ncbi:MAG TPA: response regulator transcription factor [Armatimonadota bacterium]|nr:response regulator transcription factor [Armatimonadota bacterium]
MIRVIVADDHHLVREGLVRLLSLEQDLQVVGVAGDGEECLSLVERLKPQVALVDVRMPGIGGIEATRQIATRWPETGVVLLTMHDEDEYVFEGMAAGARAYLLKDCSHQELVGTLREVAQGGAYLPAVPLRKLLSEFQSLRQNRSNRPTTPCDVLSRRELDVLEWVVRGYSNKQIARELCIDETTVKTHLHRIFEKLNVRDRTQAAIFALQRNWFSPPPM